MAAARPRGPSRQSHPEGPLLQRKCLQLLSYYKGGQQGLVAERIYLSTEPRSWEEE